MALSAPVHQLRHELVELRRPQDAVVKNAVAYRTLGSPTEADDAVQEAWLRLSRSDADEIENLGGWLTTVVARVSLATAVVHGAQNVASRAITYARLSPYVRPALVNGAAGVVTTVNDRPVAVMAFTVSGGTIVRIDVMADPERLARLNLAVLD
jgi:hypothetical protein